jgi:ATP-dependent DNA helicase RecQ
MNDAISMDAARTALLQHFGYPSFRPGQDEIVRLVLARRDTVAVMPTGGGKSICYQIPAVLFEGLTIVVSPLIALMKDQVEALERARIRATYINSLLDYRETVDRIEKARNGWFRLMYVAPERFENAGFIERMRGISIALFAVDEAHCISEWGHDFRPSYMRLRSALEHFGMPQVVALTATATPDVRTDIQSQLGLRDPAVVVRGFHRPNLSFRVVAGGNKREEILRRATGNDCGIVYAGTRRSVEELSDFLQRHGIPAGAYHAGLDEASRRSVQDRFMSGDLRMIVATSAFGMGIDKPDVRFVLHHDMPGSIEQYYQEAGRAGRDGGQSDCVLLYHPADRGLPEFFIRSTFPDRTLVQRVFTLLHTRAGTLPGQSYRGLLPLTPSSIASDLGAPVSDAAVRGALDVLERSGYIRRIRESFSESTVHFLLAPEQLRTWLIDDAPANLQPFAVSLLRSVESEAFHHPTRVFIDEFASRNLLDEVLVLAALRELDRLRVIDFQPGRRGSGIALTTARVQARDLAVDYRDIERRMRHQMEKLEAMERYIAAESCRRNIILEYFQEADVTGTCGICDACMGSVRNEGIHTGESLLDAHTSTILHCVAETGGRFGRVTLVDILRGAKTKRISEYRLYEAGTYGRLRSSDRNAVLAAVDALIGSGFLAKTSTPQPTLHVTELGRRKLGREVEALNLPRPSEVMEAEVQDRILYESLRAVRRRIAGEYNVPSHSLVPDRVLRAMANHLPRDEKACLAIEGMGPATYQKCGRHLLEAIQQHLHQSRLASDVATSASALTAMPQTIRATFELVSRGLGLSEISELRALSEGTVSQHVADMLRAGVHLSLDGLIPAPHQDRLRRAISIAKTSNIRRIRAIAGEDISFAEIRIIQALIERAGKSRS